MTRLGHNDKFSRRNKRGVGEQVKYKEKLGNHASSKESFEKFTS
jgi:hypothetical protein